MKRATWHRNAALVLPLLLVNAAALYGQQGWAFDHLGHNRVIAILFASAVESIGIYLAAEAHAALMAGDASARLRLGSYMVGALVGVLNYAHFASPGYQPNPLALTFGLLSSISPWLWAIRSRSLNRDRLRELGQVDPRAVRFSILRWVLFPVRTGRAFRGAVWAGVVQPAEAVALADRARSERTAKRTRTTLPNAPADVPAPRSGDAAEHTASAIRTHPERSTERGSGTVPSAPRSAPEGTDDRTSGTRSNAPAERGRGRQSRGRRRNGRARSDTDLATELAARVAVDGPLSVRAIGREFGIGTKRAKTLLSVTGLSAADDTAPERTNGHRVDELLEVSS